MMDNFGKVEKSLKLKIKANSDFTHFTTIPWNDGKLLPIANKEYRVYHITTPTTTATTKKQ